MKRFTRQFPTYRSTAVDGINGVLSAHQGARVTAVYQITIDYVNETGPGVLVFFEAPGAYITRDEIEDYKESDNTLRPKPAPGGAEWRSEL